MSREMELLIIASLCVVVVFRLLSTYSLWNSLHRYFSLQKWLYSLKNMAVKPLKFDSRENFEPYILPPLRIRQSSQMGMGLKRLDRVNWLTMDSNYLPEHVLRCELLETSRPRVIQCLSGTEEACSEVLDVVVRFLTSRYPEHFTSTATEVHNHITGETLPIGVKSIRPLETAARLAMEDFNILMKYSITGEYILKASVTLFPAGWELQERIGTSMANLHIPVPGWRENVGHIVNRYLPHFPHRPILMLV